MGLSDINRTILGGNYRPIKQVRNVKRQLEDLGYSLSDIARECKCTTQLVSLVIKSRDYKGTSRKDQNKTRDVIDFIESLGVKIE